jgi:excisionase family DNA binding protein
MAEFLTTTQVQEMLQVDRTTIYRMVEGGRLPAFRVGKQWRFLKPEIEQWLQAQAITPVVANASIEPTATVAVPGAGIRVGLALRDLLPQSCTQLIQDVFADLLGVMMVITDMDGRPTTRISNPCGFYAALTQDPNAAAQCVQTWQQMAASPALAPKFAPNEMGLLCARALIRVGSELRGMVVIGGIAPEVWPPPAERLACLAETFGLAPADVAVNADAVHRLDKAAQEKALRAVQRIADIFSHMVEDRNALCSRLQAIASLTAL